jgi:hypothetical protein
MSSSAYGEVWPHAGYGVATAIRGLRELNRSQQDASVVESSAPRPSLAVGYSTN